jgi:hypothetical protein
MERLRKAIREQLLALGIRNYKVLSPPLIDGSVKSIDAALQDTIDQLWDSDPVHVTDGGYHKLVDSLDVAARHLLNSSGGQHWNANPPPPHPGRWPELLPARPLASNKMNSLRGEDGLPVNPEVPCVEVTALAGLDVDMVMQGRGGEPSQYCSCPGKSIRDSLLSVVSSIKICQPEYCTSIYVFM